MVLSLFFLLKIEIGKSMEFFSILATKTLEIVMEGTHYKEHPSFWQVGLALPGTAGSNWTHHSICFQQQYLKCDFGGCSKVQMIQSVWPILLLSIASNSSMESWTWRSWTISSPCYSVPFCPFYHAVGGWTSHGCGLIISCTSSFSHFNHH